MSQISIVIITKNEAGNIVGCIESARKLSNDIIVVDSGSTDSTVLLAEQMGAKIKTITWKGYGDARNIGASLASNNWIFALDADERITDDLIRSLGTISLVNKHFIYGFNRTNFFKHKELKYGTLANERVFRLYNRQFTQWNMEPVHEKLETINAVVKFNKASILHFGINDLDRYQQKKMNYAYLCAIKYFQQGKKSPGFFRLVSPPFYFLQSYIFKAGFLDGKAGFITAKVNALYTWQKYDHLCRMVSGEEIINSNIHADASAKKVFTKSCAGEELLQ